MNTTWKIVLALVIFTTIVMIPVIGSASNKLLKIPSVSPMEIPTALNKSRNPEKSSASENKNNTTQTYPIYLIKLDDSGNSGKLIGCNDSLVPYTVMNTHEGSPTLQDKVKRLLSTQQKISDQGLTNTIAQSPLKVSGAGLKANGTAYINLVGSVVQNGVCDGPRIKSQLEQLALDESKNGNIEIFVNGNPLEYYIKQ